MQPGLIYSIALVVSAVMLVATCVGWIVDGRAPAGRALGLGASCAVVFGLVVTLTSGVGFMDAVLSAGSAVRSVYGPLLTPYTALGVGAVVAMIAAQGAGVVGRSGARAPGVWRAIGAILVVAALACMWIAIRSLFVLAHLELAVVVYLAPLAMAGVLTALLLARAIAVIASPDRPRAVAPAADPEEVLLPAAEPEEPIGQPVPTRDRTDDFAAYRRPPTA